MKILKIFIAFVTLFVLGSSLAIADTTISKEAEKLGTDKAEIGVIAYSIRD